MNQVNMWYYLKLDTFNVNIPFSHSKKELFYTLREKNVLMNTLSEKQIIIKSKLLSLDIEFSIAFYFNYEKLISIIISPDTLLEGKALYSRYNEIQRALENNLGHPHSKSLLIMNLLSPDNQMAYWQSKGIKIEHYLLNRFGIEEILKIDIV